MKESDNVFVHEVVSFEALDSALMVKALSDYSKYGYVLMGLVRIEDIVGAPLDVWSEGLTGKVYVKWKMLLGTKNEAAARALDDHCCLRIWGYRDPLKVTGLVLEKR